MTLALGQVSFQAREHARTASALRAVLAGAYALTVADTVATLRKGAASRAVFAVLVAGLALLVLPWQFALGWALAMCVWEASVRGFIENRTALAARSEAAGFRWLAAINFIGGLAYTSFPVVTWLMGGELGRVLATAWICGCATHLFVYFSSNRLLLLVTAGPLALAALITPFLGGGLSVMAAAAAATLVLLVAAASMFGHDRNVLLSVLADQAAARLSAEQANTAKSQFLTTMSHELRTPLNSVIGYAELIEEETQGAIAEDARKIRGSARQLLSVIDVILDISKLESGAIALERDRFEIAAILEHLREAAPALAAANANTITISEKGPLGEAEIDHARLYQCLLQLVSNAAKFTRQGTIDVTAERDAERLIFTVADSGIGIAPELQARIFEPFVQGESAPARRYEGAGLGLTLVQRLARLMGGDVACESTPGEGATFRLWIAIER